MASTLAALAFSAAGLAYSRGSLTQSPTASTATAVLSPDTEQLPGFLRDAWYLPDDALLGFVEIPGGPFLLGSDPTLDPLAFEKEVWADGTRDSLELGTFYMGRYEVTVAQFRAFATASGYAASSDALQGPRAHPATSVSWIDALAYCRWLDARLREGAETPALALLAQLLDDGWRLTLPTEEQWEKAARGTDGRIFPWGNEQRPDRANYGARSATPVGSVDCPECPFGLSDMSGNVWEWTRSPFPAGGYPTQDSIDLAPDALWVMRGGSFADEARNVRAAIRGGADPSVRRPFIGFRVALTRP